MPNDLEPQEENRASRAGDAASETVGVLVRDQIRRHGLIEIPDGEPEDERCYQATSYDLRLGYEYITPGQVTSELDTADILDCRDYQNRVVIEPFSSVIVSTHEIVNLPDNVIGKFNLRVKQAFRGLIVQMGTQVEPNYRGRLFALLQNITDKAVILVYRDYATRPFTIEFYYTARPSGAPPKVVLSLKDFIGNIQLSNTLNAILIQRSEFQAETQKLWDAQKASESQYASVSETAKEIERRQTGLETNVEKRITEASDKRLMLAGVVFTFAVAAAITVIGPVFLSLFMNWFPLEQVKTKAVSEAAKTLSESVRDEAERLKKRVDDLQATLKADEEALGAMSKKTQELEKAMARSRVQTTGTRLHRRPGRRQPGR